jgi:hypothetical protein
MANYLIRSCDNRTEYVVDPNGNTIVTGTTYYFTFTGETDPICGTVISEDSGSITEGLNSVDLYNNCLECLQDNNFSFLVTGCTIETGGPVSSIEFSEFALGKFYTLCANEPGIFEGCFCFEVTGIQEGFFPYTFNPVGPFDSCNCMTPRSANTESNICLEICTESGTTVVSVTPPHPEWTDGYGTQVTELNMITLGGMNGLNN